MRESGRTTPNQERTRLRLAYLSGPADAVELYKSWSAGLRPGYFGSSHGTDFIQLCSDLDAEAYVISNLDGDFSRHQLGRFLIENRPMPQGLRGIAYHLATAYWLARMIPAVIRFRPDVALITLGSNYWFLLSVLKLFGIIIIPVCTCTFWLKFAPMRASWRILSSFNSFFLSHCVAAVATASEDITRQIRSLLRAKKIPIATFLPVYPRDQFSMFHPANFDARPFRVFFAGRIEVNKGIYDLVSIAQILNQREPHRFQFDICGDGSELNALRQHIADLGLTEIITCHGFCDRSILSPLLQASHVVIVPTTTQFEEGFNMVCAESILAARPVVTSAVCPALEYVKEAVIEVPPDDVSAYCRALLDLANNREIYERKVTACKPLQEQFYDVSNTWHAKLREILDQVLPAERSLLRDDGSRPDHVQSSDAR